jgi:phosphinothricin acetyltransferase
MTPEDWPAVEAIFREGIATGNATFEAELPTWVEFDTGKVHHPRLVAVDGARVAGWTAASQVSSRCVYEGVIEHSIYVDDAVRGTGVGAFLLEAFLTASETAGMWTVQSGVFPQNEPSLALHRKLGFREMGTRERLESMSYGPHSGEWLDVVFVERQSAAYGQS